MTDQLIVRKRNSEISNFFALLVSVKISEHDRLKFIYSYFDLFIFAVNFFAVLVSVEISEHDRLKFIYSYFDLFIFAVNFFALLVSVKISEHDRLKFIYSYFDLFIFAVIASTRNYKQKHWYIFQESGVGQKAAVMQTQRELRFLSFASVEYEGNVYMTPQDFLESVTEEVPRRKCAVMRFFCSDTFVLSDRFHFILVSTYCGQ